MQVSKQSMMLDIRPFGLEPMDEDDAGERVPTPMGAEVSMASTNSSQVMTTMSHHVPSITMPAGAIGRPCLWACARSHAGQMLQRSEMFQASISLADGRELAECDQADSGMFRTGCA